MALSIGTTAPDFTGLNQHGETFSLSDYKGKKVVLFFYPKASTPGCTMEACSFRDHYADLRDRGFEIIGISGDSVRRQLNFATKQELPYNLLADEELTTVKAYEAYGLKKFMGREYMGIFRHTYVVDENGLIEHFIEKVKTKEAAAQLLSLYA